MAKSFYYFSGYTGSDTTMPFSMVINTIDCYVPAHRHDFIEMSLVISGEGTEIINGVEHIMKPGTFSLLLPWHVHELKGDAKNPLRLYNCVFGMDLISDTCGQDKDLNELIFNSQYEQPFVNFTSDESEHFSSIFDELLKEVDSFEPWGNLMFKIKITELLIRFDRYRKVHDGSLADMLVRDEKDINDVSWKVLQYIHIHYNENISLSSVAERFHFSESHLTNLIKTVTGLCFVDLLHEIRIRNACAVLSAVEDVPINAVSSHVGFSSMKTFHRVFREIKGITPEEYKRNQYKIVRGVKTYSYPSGSGTVWKIIYYIHLHYHEEISIESAAAHLHFSESYISSILKRHINQNFTDILNEIRVLNACTLLSSTDMQICDIAFEVGYESKETFFRNFRKLKKVTPGDYRKKIKLSGNQSLFYFSNK